MQAQSRLSSRDDGHDSFADIPPLIFKEAHLLS